MQTEKDKDGKLDLLKDRAPKSPKDELASQQLSPNKDLGRNQDGKQIIPKD